MLSWRNGLIPNSSLSDRSTLRVLNWADAWGHHDPAGPHWHLGPVAIEPRVQRQGIGSALLTAFCVHMDAYGAVAYLETDQRSNAHFYEKLGFAVAVVRPKNSRITISPDINLQTLVARMVSDAVLPWCASSNRFR